MVSDGLMGQSLTLKLLRLEIQCRRMDKQKADAKSVEKVKSSQISQVSREEGLVRGRKQIDGLISAAIDGQDLGQAKLYHMFFHVGGWSWIHQVGFRMM